MFKALLFDEDEWVLHGVNVLVGDVPCWAMMLAGVKDAELMKVGDGYGLVKNVEKKGRVTCKTSSATFQPFSLLVCT